MRARRAFFVAEPVIVGQVGKTNTGHLLDLQHAAAVGSELAKHRVQLIEVTALVDHISASGRFAVIPQIGHHFPECFGDFDTTVNTVIFSQHRACKYSGSGLPAPCIVENVLLKFQLGLLVERAHLRRAVSEVKSVEVGDGRFFAPIGSCLRTKWPRSRPLLA